MKVGEIGTALPFTVTSRSDRVASSLNRVTVIVYGLVVVVSGAVAPTVIEFAPTASAIAADGLPDVTGTPFTVTVALASVVVGVTVADVTALPTDAV